MPFLITSGKRTALASRLYMNLKRPVVTEKWPLNAFIIVLMANTL